MKIMTPVRIAFAVLWFGSCAPYGTTQEDGGKVAWLQKHALAVRTIDPRKIVDEIGSIGYYHRRGEYLPARDVGCRPAR